MRTPVKITCRHLKQAVNYTGFDLILHTQHAYMDLHTTLTLDTYLGTLYVGLTASDGIGVQDVLIRQEP